MPRRFSPILLFLLFTAAASGQDIAPDSLVLHLPFSGNAADASGNAYHGVVNGATLTEGPGGAPNTAYFFDGIKSSIVIPDIKKLDGTLKAFTILIRMQPQGVVKDASILPPFWPAYTFLTWHRNSTDSANAFLHSKMHTNWLPHGQSNAIDPEKAFLGYLMEWCSSMVGTASGYGEDTALVYNKWLTVAYVYNAGHLKIYHNCDLKNDWEIYPTGSDLCGTDPVQISLGNVPQGVMQYGYKYFKGKMDELRIYTRALSEAEVHSFAGGLCKPEVKPIITVRQDACYPNRVTIGDATDTTGFIRRAWRLSTGDTSDEAQFLYEFKQKSSYTITLNVYKQSGVYTKDTTIEISSLGPKRFLQTSSSDLSICENTSVQPALSGARRYQWQPCLYLDECTAASPVITPTADIIYTIIATDDSLCADTAAIRVTVVKDSNPVYMPSAFTPNNDGKNDGFGVMGGQPLAGVSLKIFNRWGQLVFHTTDVRRQWNGTYRGVPAPNGAYVWILRYNNGAGCAAGETKGTVLLIR